MIDFQNLLNGESKFVYYKQWQINIAIGVFCVATTIFTTVMIWWMRFGGYEKNVIMKRDQLRRKLQIVNERLEKAGSAVSYERRYPPRPIVGAGFERNVWQKRSSGVSRASRIQTGSDYFERTSDRKRNLSVIQE
ncbi:Oidioi.mRNA.OKI2018_I69.chr1.g295.t1.cds [Oikopleura dioica]|uniref:Oidioi.mRNA.OKI2018_I69.chr1.g295.t1.cds n=1 Tax=Oikopleura dioica TaxID=34765 RepID=A0ABN7SN86_OIKDI|nr:Oidioi.mRNA.OKI2018_I69.chr1.g295.t1.cds [Oikopleura dioica]